MEQSGVLILYQGGQGEVVEKKSRFIASLQRVRSEEDALDFVAKTRKKYWDARHNCYAFVVGDKNQIMRSNDDGEPQGTAGHPMLEALLGAGVHDAAVVVTRYFGGTLLGTGGLTRAYRRAVEEGLRNSVLAVRQSGERLRVQIDYNSLGKVQHILAQEGVVTMDAEYADTVSLQVMAPLSRLPHLLDALTEGTNGAAVFSHGEQAEFVEIDGKIEVL